MSRKGQRWIALAFAVIGVAIGDFLSHPAGVAVSFLGVFVAFGSIPRLNTPLTRLCAMGTALLHGVAIWRGSGSLLLGAAPLLCINFALPTELVSRRTGYQLGWSIWLSPLSAIVLGLLERPYTSWHFAILPTTLGGLVFSVKLLRGMSDFNRRAKKQQWKIGQVFPDFALPARLGQPEFKLADHRGKHVLVCLLRGDWCPVCHVMMRIIAKDAPILASHGVKVVAVSTAEGAEADAFARDLDVDYTILVDPKCTLAVALGTVHENEPEKGKNTNLPAMFLVDPEGRMVFFATASDLTLHDPRRVIQWIETKTPVTAAA